jgi:hypothetical protein
LPTGEQLVAQRDQWQQDERAARQAGDLAQTRDCRAMVERCTRMIARLQMLPAGQSFPYQVALWRMGDAVWVAVQGEPYNQLQTELRARYPGVPIVVVSICNHWGPAYLPPADLYGKGIYQESIAVLKAGCLERLIDRLAELIDEVLTTP